MIIHWKKPIFLKKEYIDNICIYLSNTTFLAKGTNRNIYKSITIVVKDVDTYVCVCLFTLSWEV